MHEMDTIFYGVTKISQITPIVIAQMYLSFKMRLKFAFENCSKMVIKTFK